MIKTEIKKQAPKAFRIGALVQYEYTETYGNKCKVVKVHKSIYDGIEYDVCDQVDGKFYYHCRDKNVSKWVKK